MSNGFAVNDLQLRLREEASLLNQCVWRGDLDRAEDVAYFLYKRIEDLNDQHS